MKPSKLKNPSRTFGRPKDWQGKTCETLDIYDISEPEGNFMVSHWPFSEEEIQKINQGAKLTLWVRGWEHPVVGIGID